MCGIIAGLTNSELINLIEMIINGLKMIQNRGYDSAGICANLNNDFYLEKYASTDKLNAINKLEESIYNFKNFKSYISHTRWATHGPKTDINAHPHIDTFNTFSLVHNGIIENYNELKNKLIENNFKFKSQTDTEVIVNLISYHFILCKDPELAITNALSELEGTYALVIMYKNDPNTLYCTRKGSPLLISVNDDFALIASERSGFCNYVNNYINLDNNDLCIIKNKSNKIVLETSKNYTPIKITNSKIEMTPEPYPYWFIKEIMEQTEASLRSISMGGRLLENSVKLGGLEAHTDILKDIDNLLLIGCGTSYHACLSSTYYFKDLCDFNIVMAIDGSEFTKKDLPKIGKTGVVFVSQSGETKDLHRCLEICKDENKDLILIGVINTPDSLIAREVDCGCYINAGREVSVASTKAFTCQVILLSMIAIWFSQLKKINKHKREEIIISLRRLYLDIKNTINNNLEQCKEIAKYLVNYNSTFILGKGICESSALEGSLKIKEVGYIHAEAYSSSALKHGPYSLLIEGFPIILICPDDEYFVRNMGISEEIKSRLAYSIGITDKEIKEHKFDKLIKIEKNKTYRNLLSVLPMQLIAYEVALLKGHNPDILRGLAKCVTVD
jgi:glucosamine--fructose-6-phosphate aminotransferase (isomerizing)